MYGVCTVLTGAVGFFLQPGSINSVQCRKLCPNDALGCFNHRVQVFAFGSSAAGIPHPCAVGQDALNGTPVKADQQFPWELGLLQVPAEKQSLLGVILCRVEVKSEQVSLESLVEDGMWLCCPGIGLKFVSPLRCQKRKELWLHWMTFVCAQRWWYQLIFTCHTSGFQTDTGSSYITWAGI